MHKVYHWCFLLCPFVVVVIIPYPIRGDLYGKMEAVHRLKNTHTHTTRKTAESKENSNNMKKNRASGKKPATTTETERMKRSISITNMDRITHIIIRHAKGMCACVGCSGKWCVQKQGDNKTKISFSSTCTRTRTLACTHIRTNTHISLAYPIVRKYTRFCFVFGFSIVYLIK